MDVVGSEAPPECGAGESGRSSPSPTASPEFEFWMVGKNPGSFPSPALLTADELFSDGIVLPLHTLQAPLTDGDGDGNEEAEADDDADAKEGEAMHPLAESCPVLTPDLPAVTFKWKDIFKATGESKDRKKTERRVSSVSGNSELININIWPFSRSRSAGHSAGAASALSKVKASTNANAAVVTVPASATPAGRKVSSAPCSRSNSRGESSVAAPSVAAAAAAAAAVPAGPVPATTSMLRRWVPGQGRAGAGLGVTGIRLGRASPVWQLRRNKLQQQQAAAEQKQNSNTGSAKNNKAVPDAAATNQDQDDGEEKAAAPSVSAPTTAGCRNNASCSEGGGEECNPPQGLFGLRTFFSKKVY